MRFVFNNFVLDSDQRLLWKEGGAVALSPKVFETLELLLQSNGRIVTKREFMAALWPDSFVEDSNLTQNIFVLRKILGSSSDGRPYIETYSRRGYRFAGVVRPEEVDLQAAAPKSSASISEDTFPALPFDRTVAVERSDPIEASASLPQLDKANIAVSWGRVSLAGLVVFLLFGIAVAQRWHSKMRIGAYQRITNDGRSKSLREGNPVLVTDGEAIYFTEDIGDKRILARVPTDGGEMSSWAVPLPWMHIIGLQPGGGGGLLFAADWPFLAEQQLLKEDMSSGAVAPVFDIHAQDANWSSDRTKLAYAQLGNVFVRSSDGKTLLLASVAGVAYWPRWSPDGRVLRFSENYQGYHDRLWEVDSAGRGLHQLFADQGDSDHMCCGSWTKSGKGFAYLSIQTNNSKIHIRSERRFPWSLWSQQAIDISAAPLDQWTAPLPGPDGKHLFAIGEQLHGRLVRIDPASRRAEPYIGGISAEGVSFSPNETSIVWTAYPEGTLWRSRSDGSGRVQLTQAPLVARFPHWSPDGSTIVFMAARPGSDWHLYTVPANGGEIKVLVPESRGQGVATWSPDSKALAFGHLLDAAQARTQPFDIEIFHLGDQSSVTVPGSTGLWTARWSPDGRYLSAVTKDNQTLRLYDMQAGTWSDLAHSNVNDVVWSPDSKSLFFDMNVGSDPVLYRVRLSDRKVEAWASLREIRRAGFFSPWLGMSPDGAPILLEDASLREVYSIGINLP